MSAFTDEQLEELKRLFGIHGAAAASSNVTEATATGVASITISDLDLNTVRGYEFIVMTDGSTSQYLQMRMNGDTDNDYAHQMKQTEDSTTDGITDGNIIWLQHSTAGLRSNNSATVFMTRPGVDEIVAVHALSVGVAADDTTIPVAHYTGAAYTSNANVTSVTFFVNTGTANWLVYIRPLNA